MGCALLDRCAPRATPVQLPAAAVRPGGGGVVDGAASTLRPAMADLPSQDACSRLAVRVQVLRVLAEALLRLLRLALLRRVHAAHGRPSRARGPATSRPCACATRASGTCSARPTASRGTWG